MVIVPIDKIAEIYWKLLFSRNIFQKWIDVFNLHNFLWEIFYSNKCESWLVLRCCVQPPTAWSLAKKRWVWAKYLFLDVDWLSFASDIGMSWRHSWNFGNCADTKYCRMLFFRIYFVYQLLYYIFVVPDVNVNWGDTQTYCQCCRIWAEPGTCSNSPDWIVYRHASDGHKVHATFTNLHFVPPLSPLSSQESKSISFLHL